VFEVIYRAKWFSICVLLALVAAKMAFPSSSDFISEHFVLTWSFFTLGFLLLLEMQKAKDLGVGIVRVAMVSSFGIGALLMFALAVGLFFSGSPS
jgi:hypothetical protein